MDTKKVVAIAVLVVVIVLAAVLTARRTSSSGAPAGVQTDQGVAGIKVDKIDNKTFEVFTETNGDWNGKYKPDASDPTHFKNPKTGEYTVVNVIKCASCGAEIPAPDAPADVRSGKVKGIEAQKEIRDAMAEYKCPKCGKNAYNFGGR